MTPNKLSQRLPPFWVMQLCGWSVYGLTVFIAFLAVRAPGRSALALFWIKLVKAALGFLRVWHSASSFRVIGAAALGGSALFGLLWITSYNLFFAWQNNQPFNLGSWNYWSRQLGNVLDFVYVMFGWSALYFDLKYWQERLPEKHFARIHRSTIINLEYVERIEGWFNRSYQIHLRHLNEPLLVSRRYAAQLKQKFG